MYRSDGTSQPIQTLPTSRLTARYTAMESDRESYVSRAIDNAALTLPYVFPKNEKRNGKLSKPYQSVGAEGVSSLCSRIMMVTMPPNRPLFRLRIDKELSEKAGKDQASSLEAALSRIEQNITAQIETLGDRVQHVSMYLHLLIAGNVLVRVHKDGMRVYPLRNYVVRRDPNGEPLEIIVREEIDPRILPKERQAELQNLPQDSREQPSTGETRTVTIYTAIVREPRNWRVYQECQGRPIGKPGTHPLDRCPWIPLRMYAAPGENYGRSYVEGYYGDLYSLENLSKAIVKASSAAAKVIILRKPSATTSARDLKNADNMEIISGNIDDIGILKLDKMSDFQVARATADRLEQRLARAFLMNTAIQRDAERVTAEEIRLMAQQLESALGGLYTMLSNEWQRPYVTLRLHYFKKSGDYPNLGEDAIHIKIVTGVDALGRGQDASRLIDYAKAVTSVVPPEMAVQYLNVPSFMRNLCAAMGIDDVSILKTEDQIAQEQQQSQRQALLQQVAPNAVNQLGGLAREAERKTRQP